MTANITSEFINFKKICNDKDNPSIILTIIGDSGSGKTTLLKYILCEAKSAYTHVFLFQGSMPSEDNVYTNYIWPGDIKYIRNISDKFNLEANTKNIKEYMENVTIHNNNISDINKKNNNKKPIPFIKTLFIFDDFGNNNRLLTDLTIIARHSYTSFAFLIHNDTDIDVPLRKKVTHYLINVNFTLNQILENFKNIKNDFEFIRKSFLEKRNNKCFLLIEKQNLNCINYCFLEEEQVKKIRNDSSIVFYKTSKQRKLFKDLLLEIYNEEITKNK